MKSSDPRQAALLEWLRQHLTCVKFEAIQGDASARRYFRVYTAEKAYIAVDVPVLDQDSKWFVRIAKALTLGGLRVPDIYHYDEAAGFLLLSDFGNVQLLAVLQQHNADHWYSLAMKGIINLQQCYHFVDWQLPWF